MTPATTWDPARVAVVAGSRDWSYADLADDSDGLRTADVRDATAATHTSDAGVVAAALVALEGWCAEVHLLPPTVPVAALPPAAQVLVGQHRGTATVEPPRDQVTTHWVVYTSGTTGEPKAIQHTKASLTRTVVQSDAVATLTWGLLYDPNRMAGLQVLHQGLATGATVVAPELSLPVADRIAQLIDRGVNALSATPTLWRLILQLPSTRRWPLRQITLGGEIADQRVLDGLATQYPDARISHVFASTETGAAFSVSDRRAGFPVAYLDDPPRGVRLQVRGGVLHVYSPGVSAAGPDGFASTGDVVEVVEDRVVFKGRATGVANVGGTNVWPEEVERMLRGHPDVVDAEVTFKPNPFSGQILVARVVPGEAADVNDLPKQLRIWMKRSVPKAYVPATISITRALDLSETGKALRR